MKIANFNGLRAKPALGQAVPEAIESHRRQRVLANAFCRDEWSFGDLQEFAVLAFGSNKGVRNLYKKVVAVGMALSGHPPHGSVREELPHTALASGM